jgi:hypothetical protein
MLVYKVVETSTVTDEELERILNEWTRQGWTLDGVRFVLREASRRPAMAFVTFTREVSDEEVAFTASAAAHRKKIP